MVLAITSHIDNTVGLRVKLPTKIPYIFWHVGMQENVLDDVVVKEVAKVADSARLVTENKRRNPSLHVRFEDGEKFF